MVVWLLGMSGVGKSTLGKQLKSVLDHKNISSYIIDGDIVRDFFDNDLGYTKEERKANIKRILLAVHVLEKNGVIPIVCNISPFQELRDFARQKFDEYIEVYLKRELTYITNKKNVYNDKNVIGVDIEFEEPISPTLIIDTYEKNEKESLKMILECMGISNEI